VSQPLIGITLGHGKGSSHVQQRASYFKAIESAGGLPVGIPLLEVETLRALFDRLDGVVFPGGPDVDPAFYGEASEPRTEIDPELDRVELALANWAIDSELPTLGICRGQQLLNVALGGSLIQHLDRHRQEGDRKALTQPLSLTPGSRLAEIFGGTETVANTMHHQAVRKLGRGLKAVAWAEDGTIEGMESEAHPWLLMVQFHPEELFGFHAPSQRLFAAFVQACRVRKRIPAANLR
jgi:putative glutamine amidotransferase